MNKYFYLFLNLVLLINNIIANKDSLSRQNISLEEKDESLIYFRFNQASLLEIIDMIAEQKKINIVIPAGQQSITEKITFDLPNKITIDEAWQHLLKILKICGYSAIQQKEFVSIIKNDVNEISRQSYTLYIHTPPEKLPDTEERIRYLYYFYNLQLNGLDGGASVVEILKSFLSTQATILIDEGVNGIIITDTARHIASTMTFLKELDVRQDANDGCEIIQLKHTIATSIASYLQSIINPGGKQAVSDIGAPSQSSYFSKSVRIVAEPRTNSLILLGKKDALQRTKNFILEYIDIKLDAGESILHIYDLQHLDAPTFRQTLTNILSSQSNGSTYGSQSSGSSQETAGKQYFKDVKIISEALQSVNPASLDSSSLANGSGIQTGNRLIIAAKREDWLRIEKLIQELDKPQLQVAIEVLIVDLNIAEDKELGSQLRNLTDLNLQNVNFQTSHLGGDGNNTGAIVQKSGNATSADVLKADMLQSWGTNNIGQQNMVSKLSAGSFILSFKDPNTSGMWLVSQILNSYEDTKILSQPFIIALNNQTCLFTSSEKRFLPGGSNVIPGGGGVQSYEEAKEATLTVKITPMIGRDSDVIKITLALNIDIQEFKGDSTERLTRNIQTNVTVGDGDILILGGLTKTQITKSENSTPGLSKIPIIGNLFKSKAKSKTKDNLLVFISPRIIMPRKGMRFDPFTENKIANVSNLFDNYSEHNDFKDPITHWFFGSEIEDKSLFDIYGKQTYSKLFIDKNEKTPQHLIKKIKVSLPSPDKIDIENKENTTNTLSQEIKKEETKIESVKPKIPKISKKKPTIKTENNIKKNAKKITVNNNINNNDDDELKNLSSLLKKPDF